MDNTRSKTSNNSSNHHLRNTKRRSLYHSAHSNHRTANNHLTGSTKYITRPDRGHGAHETTEIVHRGHCCLHVGRWVIHCLEEVFAYDDVAKDALLRVSSGPTNGYWRMEYLIVSVEDDDGRCGDGDPDGEGITGAAPVFPGHVEDIEVHFVV